MKEKSNEKYEEKFQQKYTDLRLWFFLHMRIMRFYRVGAYRERDFSPKGWMNCDPAKRYLYIEDFEEKYDVVGMQRSDIEDLLGSPTWRETEPDTEEIIYYEYRIQDHILAGWKVYQIRFQDDLVADTSIIVEDW